MKEKEKTYIDDSNFMEFIDELATQITEMNLCCWQWAAMMLARINGLIFSMFIP